MKSFNLWLEEKLEKRELTTTLLSRLGRKANTLDRQDIIISTIPESEMEAAIQSLPLNDDAKEKLNLWAKSHQQEGIINLLNQIDLFDVEKQDKEFSEPASLPQGQQPLPKPQIQQ